MAKAGELIIDLAANVARLQKDMREATNVVGRASKQMESAANGVKNALGALGVGVSAAALAAFAKSTINAADELGKMSQKVGIAVEELSALDYAAKLSDVSTEQLQTGLAQLARQVDANHESFGRLGIDLEKWRANGGSVRDLIGDIADRFSRMEDGAEKTAIAQDLLGRSGANLIPLLNQGRAGLADLTEEAKRLGLVVDSETAKAAEEFNDNLTTITITVEAMTRNAISPLIARLADLTTQFRVAREAGMGFWEVFTSPGGTTAEDRGREIFRLRELLQKLQADRKVLEGHTLNKLLSPEDLKLLDFQIARVTKELAFLEQVQAATRGFQELPLTKTPPLPAPEKGKKKKSRTSTVQSDIPNQMLENIQQQADAVREANEARLKHQQAQEDAFFDLRLDNLERYADEEIEAAENMADIMEDINKKMADDHKKAFEEMKRTIEGFGRQTARTFAEMLVDGEFTAEGLKSVFRSFFVEMIEMQLYKGVFGPVFNELGGLFGFGGGASAAGTPFGLPVGGNSWTGGPVQKGIAYPVGEMGPEYFVPSVAGSIIPNDELGGGSVTIVQNIHVDSRSDVQTVYAAARMGAAKAKADILRSAQRNGPFAKL